MVELSAVNLYATTMELQWHSAEPSHALLRYGIDSIEENEVSSGEEASTDHLVRLDLLRPDTEYLFRVELSSDGVLVGSETGSFQTPEVPDELPDLDIPVNELDEPGFILTALLGEVMAAVVISQEGYYAWWHLEENQDLTIARVRLGPDGRSVYYNAYDRGERVGADAEYHMRRVEFDDGSVESFDIHGHHHDFVVHDDGTVGWIWGDMRWVGSEIYRGDAIIETNPSGDERVIWSTWDHLAFDMSEECNDSEGTVWTHANALHYDRESDTYYMSLRELDTVVAIDRSTGGTRWKLGGCESDFTTRDNSRTDGQHQILPVDGGLLVYDNRPDEAYSRVVEFALDHDTHVVRERWTYAAGGAYRTDVLGDVHRLPSGDTLVAWSTAGVMDQVDVEGELTWQAVFGFGTMLGYNTVLE